MDSDAKQNTGEYYEPWKIAALQLVRGRMLIDRAKKRNFTNISAIQITNPTKRQEIENVISSWESQPAYAVFNVDKVYWSHGLGYQSCFLV